MWINGNIAGNSEGAARSATPFQQIGFAGLTG
jgi:hypothetical protein